MRAGSQISTFMSPTIFSTYLSVLEVDLISQHHEGEVFRIPGTGLDEKLISPAIEGFEGVGGSHVKHQHAAVCTPVEGHAQRLEALLPCCVPDLQETSIYSWGQRARGGCQANGLDYGATQRQVTSECRRQISVPRLPHQPDKEHVGLCASMKDAMESELGVLENLF